MPYYSPANKDSRDKYNNVSRLHDEIDRLFGGFFPTGWMRTEWPEKVPPVTDFIPALEVFSNEQSYILNIELPGVAADSVSIRVAENVLTISGEKKAAAVENATAHVQERSYGSFSRSLSLPDDADAENISAFAKDGVLRVEIPRRKPEAAKVRTIEVQRG